MEYCWNHQIMVHCWNHDVAPLWDWLQNGSTVFYHAILSTSIQPGLKETQASVLGQGVLFCNNVLDLTHLPPDPPPPSLNSIFVSTQLHLQALPLFKGVHVGPVQESKTGHPGQEQMPESLSNQVVYLLKVLHGRKLQSHSAISPRRGATSWLQQCTIIWWFQQYSTI